MLRKLHLKLLMPSILVSLAILVACNKTSLDITEPEQAAYVDLPYIEAELLKNPVISDASETEDMAIVNDGTVDGLNEDIYAFRTHSGRIAHLIDCLDSLQITQGQRDSIRMATRLFNQCRIPHVRAIMQIHRTILHQARLQRMALMNDYHNNVITFQQLRQALHQLNMQTRYAIINHPGKLQHLQALQQCHQVYISRLQNILGPQAFQELKDCLQNL